MGSPLGPPVEPPLHGKGVDGFSNERGVWYDLVANFFSPATLVWLLEFSILAAPFLLLDPPLHGKGGADGFSIERGVVPDYKSKIWHQ